MMITTKDDQFRKQESVNSNFTMIPGEIDGKFTEHPAFCVQPSMIYLNLSIYLMQAMW
jgi:hypothetical protein